MVVSDSLESPDLFGFRLQPRHSAMMIMVIHKVLALVEPWRSLRALKAGEVLKECWALLEDEYVGSRMVIVGMIWQCHQDVAY